LFCIIGVYDIEQSRRILLAGKQIGLELNFHGDELNYTGSAEVSFCYMENEHLFLSLFDRWVPKLVQKLLVI
jgi:hypothetical protein